MTKIAQKGFSPLLILLVIAVIAFGGWSIFSSTKKSPLAGESTEKTDKMMDEKEDEKMMGDEEMMKKVGEEMMGDGENMMKKEDEMMKSGSMMKYSGAVLAGKSALLLDFNKADYDAAAASDKLIALYFYANWCPICREELPNALYPAFNELTTDKVVGFRVNYNDNETNGDEKNLAKEFGVAYQHTKVFLKNGQRALKSPESWDKERYLREINGALAN